MNDTQIQVHTGACPKCFGPVDADTFWCRACHQQQLDGTGDRRTARRDRSSEDALPVNSVVCAAGFTLSLMTVVALSVGSRVVFEINSAERFWYSVLQIVGGLIALGSAHVASYVHGLRYTDDVEVGEILTNPLGIWQAAITDLPESWVRVTTGIAGLLAVFLGITIVDGITLDHLLGERDYPEGVNLAKYFAREASASGKQQADKSELTLEEAIDDFTGNDGDAHAADSAIASQASSEQYDPWNRKRKDEARAGVTTSPTQLVRCVILGFIPGDSDGVSGLALGAVFKNRLQFAGVIQDGVEQHVSSDDIVRFGSLLQKNSPLPGITVPVSVFWIKPSVTCDVKCRGVDEEGRLIGAVLQQIN